MFSFVGDTVVDTFAGTGTTALAAIETGRHSISVEVEPAYLEFTIERLRQHTVTAQVEVHRPDQPEHQIVGMFSR